MDINIIKTFIMINVKGRLTSANGDSVREVEDSKTDRSDTALLTTVQSEVSELNVPFRAF